MVAFLHWYKRTLYVRGSVTDQLSCTWSAIIFLVTGIVMFWLQISIDPISCWTPAEFTAAMVSFSHKHCWYANKIYSTKLVASETSDTSAPNLPVVKEGLLDEESTYVIYQWLPLLVIFQSFFYKLPDIIWKCGMSTLGISPSKLFGTADGYGNLGKAERKLVGKQMARYLYSYVLSSTLKGCPWGLISLLWIFVKSLYFVNVVTQFTMMRRYFLDYNSLHWIGNNNINETNRHDIPLFPKSVLCEFEIRKFQRLHMYTIQCDLPCNRLYERFYALLTLWLLFILVVTTVSCFVDAVKFIIPVFRKRFIESYLSMIDDTTLKPQETGVSYFSSFLGQDILIILKLVADSSNELLVGDTVIALWEIHSGHERGTVDPHMGGQRQAAPPPHVMVTQGDPGELQCQSRPPYRKTDVVPLVPVASGSNIYPKPT